MVRLKWPRHGESADRLLADAGSSRLVRGEDMGAKKAKSAERRMMTQAAKKRSSGSKSRTARVSTTQAARRGGPRVKAHVASNATLPDDFVDEIVRELTHELRRLLAVC